MFIKVAVKIQADLPGSVHMKEPNAELGFSKDVRA